MSWTIFGGIDPVRCTTLAALYQAGHSVHIGTGQGVLSINVRDDSGGLEITAEVRPGSLARVLAGTSLLLIEPAEVRITTPPGAHAELHIGDAYVAFPRHFAQHVSDWLQKHIGSHAKPLHTEPAPVVAQQAAA